MKTSKKCKKKRRNKKERQKGCEKLVQIYELCCNLEIDSLSFCKCFVWHNMKTILENRF